MNTRRVVLGTAAVIGAGFWKLEKQYARIAVLKGIVAVWRCSFGPGRRQTKECEGRGFYRRQSTGPEPGGGERRFGGDLSEKSGGGLMEESGERFLFCGKYDA